MRKETWSVELEANSWCDDTFNGTYAKCVEWCKEHSYTIDGQEARLAKIVLEDDCVVDTLEIVEEI